MRRGYFNWKLALVLVLAVVVVAATAVGLRQYQKTGRAAAALKVGNAAYEQGDWDEAASNLGRYIGLHQEDVSALMKYAHAQLRRRPATGGHVQQAIAAYRNVLRADRSNAEAAQRLCEVYLAPAVASPGEAELIASRYLNDNPGPHPEIRYLLGAAMARLGRFDQARQEWAAVIEASPGYAPAYEAMGRLAEERPADANEPASHWFDLAVQRDPNSAGARIARAGFHARQGRSAEAIADLEAAESKDLSDYEVRIRLAQQWLQAGDLGRARAHLEALAQTSPSELTLWQTWAELAMRTQSTETMGEVAAKGLDALGKGALEFMPVAGEMLVRSGQLDRASQCIAQMRAKEYLPAAAAFLEGLIWQQRDNPVRAVKSWQDAMSLGNKTPQIRLLLASAYTQLGDLQSARVQLKTVCSEHPNVAAGHAALARLLARTGDWTGALEQSRELTRLSPGRLDGKLAELEIQVQMLGSQGGEGRDQALAALDGQLAGLEGQPGVGNAPRFLRVQAALIRRDIEAAKDLLAKVTPADPTERLRVALMSAEMSVVQDKTEEAIQTLEAARVEFPDATEPARSLAVLLLRRTDQAARCEEVLKQALGRARTAGAKRELGLLLGAAYDRWGRGDEAIALFDGLAQADPNAIWVRRRLLEYPKVLSDTGRGQKLVDQIKAIEGEAGWQWRYEQARVWFAAKDFSRDYAHGVTLLKENVLANPNDRESRRLLAGAYERAGEMQLALTTYRQALDQWPDDLSLVIATVSALYRAGEYDQADRILAQASSRKLSSPALEGLQLQSYLRQGELDQAGNMMEEVWNRDPNNPRIGLSMALLKLQQGRLDEAGGLLDQIHRLDPNSLPVASARVQVFLRQGRSEEAVKVCDAIVALRGDAASHILRGRVLLAVGRADAASADLDTAVDLEPRNPQVWLIRSESHRVQGRTAQALTDMDRALALDPNSATVQRTAIPLLLTSREPHRVAQAKAMLDKAVQDRPEDVDLQMIKVQLLLESGLAPSVAEAERTLQSLTTNWPRSRGPWLLWANLLLNQAEPGKAMDVASRGLAHNPGDRGLLLLKARAEATLAPRVAVPTLRGLYESDPNDSEVVVQLASAYLASGQAPAAVTLLQGHLKVCAPAYRVRCQTALALALHRQGDAPAAAALLKELAVALPDEPAVVMTQARLLADGKRWADMQALLAEWSRVHPQDLTVPSAAASDLARLPDAEAQGLAEQILRGVLTRQPESVQTLHLLAQILQQGGRTSDAVEVYRKILDLDRTNLVAMNNMAWILCEEQDRAQEAVALADRGLEINRDYVDLVDTRGVAYYRLGRYDKAVEDLARCVEMYPAGNPAGAGSRFHLARAYAKLKRSADAIRLLKEALDLHKRIGGLTAADVAEAEKLLADLQP